MLVIYVLLPAECEGNRMSHGDPLSPNVSWSDICFLKHHLILLEIIYLKF